MEYDVAIIGAGVSGASTAWQLSRYHVKTVLVERWADVGFGVSKANSGIIHGGFHHPANKQDVGRRLALEAERIAYGKKIVSRGPLFRAAKEENGALRVSFDNAEGGLKTSDGKAPNGMRFAWMSTPARCRRRRNFCASMRRSRSR